MLKKYCYFIFSFFFFIFSLTAYAEDTINALFHSANDPIIGNPNGKVTIVEFFDYQCGHCESMASVLESVTRANPDIRIVLKDYPIFGATSLYAAQAALAANLQGKYKQLHFALMATNRDFTKSSIIDIAQSQGLKIEKLKKDMNSPAINNQISHTQDLASFLRIPGTPAIFIGKTDAANAKEVLYISGEISASELQKVVKELAS
jgi:protein-disulfide isomerase